MWPFRRSPRPGPDPQTRQAASDASLGRRGEDLAARHLKKHGLKILARNYRCPVGEADIIALDTSTRKDCGAETIAIVEVKTRSSDAYTDPASAVNADKQRRMRKVARYYLAGRDAADFNVRFDVVSIVARQGQDPDVRHIPGAF